MFVACPSRSMALCLQPLFFSLQAYLSSNLRFPVRVRLTIRMVPLTGANQNITGGACNSSAIHVDLRLGALSVLAAWRGKVSELLSKTSGCSRTTCFISFEADYEAVAAPEPAVAASPGKTSNTTTSSVRDKGRGLKVDAKGGSAKRPETISGGGGDIGRVAAPSSSAPQAGGRQGSGKAQRSEWQAWLAPFKEMQLEPVQVCGGWRCVCVCGGGGGRPSRRCS